MKRLEVIMSCKHKQILQSQSNELDSLDLLYVSGLDKVSISGDTGPKKDLQMKI